VKGSRSSLYRSALSLGLVAVIGTTLLSGVNRLTAERIAEQERRVTEVPRARRDVPPLPADGVEAGRVYVAREGLVVYWGAEEYFEFQLDNTEGAELTLNGEVCDLGDVGPEQVKMLFRRSLQPGGQR